MLALDLGAVHDPAGVRVEGVAPVHGATVVPDQHIADAPVMVINEAILRRVLGQAFNQGEMNAFDIDLIDVFYWAALAQVARDYAWRDERLEAWCEYLEYPVRRTFGPTTFAFAS